MRCSIAIRDEAILRGQRRPIRRKTKTALFTPLCKQKVASKATHSCRHCCSWDNIPPFRLCRPELQDDERLLAFGFLQNVWFLHSSIRVQHGKTQVWNKEGVVPHGIDVMEAVARIHDPRPLCGEVTSHFPLWTSCCTRFRRFQICSELGCCCIVAPLGPTTFSAWCTQT